MANGDLLREIKQYAEDENKSLPPRLFQRLMLRATARLLDESADINTRVESVENRHQEEDRLIARRGKRRWDLILLTINSAVATILALIALMK